MRRAPVACAGTIGTIAVLIVLVGVVGGELRDEFEIPALTT